MAKGKAKKEKKEKRREKKENPSENASDMLLIENRRLSLRFFDIFAVYVLRNHGAGLLFYEKTEEGKRISGKHIFKNALQQHGCAFPRESPMAQPSTD